MVGSRKPQGFDARAAYGASSQNDELPFEILGLLSDQAYRS
jgi:hypothetical protein